MATGAACSAVPPAWPACAVLTGRAAGFLACSIALYLAGLLTGVRELFMLAVGALALPLGAWLIVRAGRARVTATRTVRPVRVTAWAAGSRSAWSCATRGRMESGVLLVSDRVPYQLGPSARFVVAGLPSGAIERLGYELTGVARGRYQLGPTSLRLSDPFTWPRSR